jgi:hypothetical protein
MYDLITNDIFDKKFKDRFFQKVHGAQTVECWIWDGAISDSGYGWISYDKSQITVHRASYIMYYGPIPENKIVLHKCDNRRCVSPYHLYAGTYSDNMLDRSERNHKSFDFNRDSQFTQSDSLVMKNLKEQGFTYESIGKVYGVTGHTISDIVNGRITRLREDSNV